MPRNTTIENIIASGMEGRSWRVLTCAPQWPSGEPPFAEGEMVTLPAIGTPPLYDPATFNPAIWTNCRNLVSDFHFNQEGTMPCDQLSLSVPAAWRAALAPAFQEMRAVVVQTRHRSGALDTGWVNLCFCLSDGYQESWEGGRHQYVVNAKSVLKLANLEVLGARTGRAVFQADLVQVGAYGTPASLALVASPADADEYGVVDGNGHIHPNWTDRPGPQCWCTNARNASGTLETEPVPLSAGGQAVQAVFGDGVVRVGKIWAHTSSNKNGNTDYSQGLGIPDGTAPTIVALVWRFAHPAVTDRTGAAVAADVVDGLTVIASSAGSVQLSAAVRSQGLTLVLRDGTGRRYATVGNGTSTDTLTLSNSSITVPTGTAVSYGDANRATDVLQRMLLGCGFQQLDDTAPFYLHTPEVPVVAGAAQDIMLPPLVYQDTEKVYPLEAITRLRQQGYLPPNYLLLDDSAGQVAARSVTQLAPDNAAVLPLAAVALSPGLQYDRSDLGVVTRVVARGLRRQVLDLTQGSGVTISDVTPAHGGLADPATYVLNSYGVTGHHARSSPGGNDYLFPLAKLFSREIISSNYLRDLCPWGWYIYLPHYAGFDYTLFVNQSTWIGKVLCEIDLQAEQIIEAVDIQAANTWAIDWSNYGGDRPRGPSMPQTIALQYFDAAQARWYPFISGWSTPIEPVASARKTQDEFDTRTAVSTRYARLVCEYPFHGVSYTGEGDFNFFIGVWLSQLKLWGSGELRGVAELGNSSNYDAAMSSSAWADVLARMRSRTEVLQEAVPWATTQSQVDWLALAWLQEYTHDLAPRRLAAVRPDTRKWDTVRFTTPRGDAASYLVTSVDHSAAPEAGISCVNYAAPYFEGE